MKRRLSIFLIITMLFSSFNVFAENENGLSDISGHWAEEIIRMEYERGLVSGYPDNTFKPDKMMTNAELITFINHCFGLKESSDDNYHDVAAEKWYASEAAKAKYYGYIESLNANPEQMAKREDVVNIMSSLMDFEEENVSDPGADFSDIDDESLEKKVERMSRLGYINGFEDGTFRPEESLTRAEILSISYRALGYIVKSQDDLKKLPKNVSKITIINPDIKIENMDLKSDLYIAPGAGGNIKLKNVNVNGNIIISGGSGDKGIEIENISAKNIAVTKSKTPLKVRIFGENKIAKITTKTPVSIRLSGSTEINEILSRSDTKIDIGKGITIKKLIIDSKTELSGGDDSSIDEVQANAEAEITGKIKVKNAIIKSENVKIENRPSYVKIDENVEKVEIDDSKMDSKNDDYADSKKSSGGSKKDRIPPSGYDLKFEQESINIENRSNVAIAFTSAENASKYSYKIEDSIGKYVEGSGVIAGTEHKVENIDLRTLSDGEIKLTGRLTDVSGNTGTIVSDKISKDTKRPDGYGLRIDYQPINKSTEKYFSFSIEDGEAGADYIYEIEDIGNDSVNGSGRMKSEFQNIDDIDVSGLSDGRLNLSLYLMDGVGNRGNTVSEDVYKDTSVEGDAIVRFDQEVINKKNVKDVSFSVVGAEHESNFNYEIYNEDDKKTKISGSEKALSKIETVDGLDLSKIDDGTVCFSVYLKDSAGNRGIDMTSRLRKDTLEPDGYGVEILQERIDSSNEKHMSFKISNGEIGCKYEFKFDDEDSSTRSVEGSGTIDTRNQSVDEVDISGLSDGNISLVLVLKDGAGNSGDKVDDSVIKDATAASGYSVEIEQKIINDSNKSSMSFVLSGAESGSTYYYKLNDSDSKTAAVLGEGTAAGESNRVENIDASGLSDGTITLEVYLVDESENKGSSVKDTVDKDTVAPEGYMVKIDPDKVNDSNHNDISFTFSGAEVGANYNYSISDGTKEVKLSGTISDSDESIDDIDVSRLSDGTLTLRVILIDVAGNEGQETTDTVIKDATAPSGYTVDIDQDRIDDSNQSVMSFVFGGAEVGSNYSYRVSDGTGEVSDTGTISTSTEKVSGIDVSGLSDGTLTLKVKLDDGFGNKGLEVVDTIVKDTDSPSGYSVSIDQDSINNSNKAAMSFTFSSAEVGATYSYTVSDGTSQVNNTGIISTATDTISDIDVTSLSDGTLTLSVNLTDASGNEGSLTTDTVSKDVVAPIGYGVSIDQDSINNSNKTAMSFTFLSAEVGATYSYTVSDGSSQVSDKGTVFTATDMISNIDVTSLSDGTLTLSVNLTDVSGNGGSAATDMVSKDATAPSGYGVFIDQDSINNSNKAAMSFTFSSAEVGATYSYTVSDGTSQVSDTGTILTAADTISDIDVTSLSDGTLTLSVNLTDTFGNEGSAATDTVTKDVVAPSGYGVFIDQDSINNSNKAAMSFTFSSAEVGSTYSYTVSDGTSQVSDTGIISTATDQISNIDVGSLSDGTLTLSVKLTDEAGNEGSPATDTIEKSTEVEAPNSYTVSYPGENYPEEGIYTKTDEVINSKMVYKFVNGANEVFKIYWSDTKNRWELHDINHTVKMGHSKSPNQGDIPPTEGWIAADESDSYWGDYTVTSN